MNKLFSYLLIGLCLFSCSEKPVFQTEKSFEDNNWSFKDSLEFGIEIPDSTTLYNLDLFIDHGVDFSFQNIYLKIATIFPGGKEISNTIPIDFADKFGNWHGKCSGENCKLRVFLRQDFKFRNPGPHKFRIVQYSREDSLRDIESVKVALFESK